MSLKNYTSSVPVERTISRIEQVLAKAGAGGIMKDYDCGGLVALAFKNQTRKLPCPQSHK